MHSIGGKSEQGPGHALFGIKCEDKIRPGATRIPANSDILVAAIAKPTMASEMPNDIAMRLMTFDLFCAPQNPIIRCFVHPHPHTSPRIRHRCKRMSI